MTEILVPPLINKPSKIDLESGEVGHVQCRICLESRGRDFIAPCKCKGTSKYVHRKCLDHWRAVKEGFAFAHCTTCRAPFYLRVNDVHRKWRTLKFRFFVTTDVFFIFVVVQLVISALGYLVYVIDTHQKSWLRLHYGFGPELAFYYLCGALLFLVLMGVAGCFAACFNKRVRDNLDQPCNNLLSCCRCCCNMMCENRRNPHTTYICIDSGDDCDCSCCGDCCRSGCESGDSDECGAVLLVLAVIVIGVFAIVGLFYSVLVASMVGQWIWQRHYHILEKRMLTKEYVVEDAGEVAANAWFPPRLPQEHIEQLGALGLL